MPLKGLDAISTKNAFHFRVLLSPAISLLLQGSVNELIRATRDMECRLGMVWGIGSTIDGIVPRDVVFLAAGLAFGSGMDEVGLSERVCCGSPCCVLDEALLSSFAVQFVHHPNLETNKIEPRRIQTNLQLQ